MINESRLTTRYSETDQMGVIYHANYFKYFEIGRTDLLRMSGMSYKDMEDMGIMMPVIDVGCKYKVSAKYDDKLIIRSKVAEMTATRVKFNYEVIREEDNVLLAVGMTEHVFLSKDTGRPVNLKKKYSELYERLLQYI